MTLDIEMIEAILRQHWEIPRNLTPGELHNHAFKIQVLLGQKYSHENLKYQLSLIQTTKLRQNANDQACGEIASELLRIANG
jgi:hypothetical protein